MVPASNVWHSLSTEPPHEIKKGQLGLAHMIDVLVKKWNPKSDSFYFERYVMCEWLYGNREFAHDGIPLSDHGRPTYYMLVEFPPT